jgi:DNA-binding winged helix-turn-helix (wHTH) protein/TolB-like protein/Tfp pilus assembly protein PilF
MYEEKPLIYSFDEFTLDVRNRELLRGGKPVILPAKAFDMLVALIENGGSLVSKDQLFSRVWPHQVVEESNLTVQVSAIRKALGDRTSNPKYLLTVPGHGYRFIGALICDDGDLIIEKHSIARIEEIGLIEDVPQSIPATVTNATAKRSISVKAISIGLVILGLAAAASVVLRRSPTRSSTPIRSIAVLPFKPLVESNRDEFLELGITDTLIMKLNRLTGIQIRPTSAVRKYTSVTQDPLVAGREQQVDAVLDGTIQRSSDRIRVNVTLVSVHDGRQIWADSFDEPATDFFALQDSISQHVASAVHTITSGEKALLAKHYTENVEAYNLYLKGRFLWNKRHPGDLHRAIEYFNQALKIDPSYALAHLGLAETYAVLPAHSPVPFEQTAPHAKAHAQRALELDGQLFEAYTTLASIASDEWQWSEAEKQFKRALELNANYATAHQWYGEYLVHIGPVEEALQELKRAQELNPTSLIIGANLGQALYLLRRFDESIEQHKRTLELDQNFVTARWLLGLAYQQKGMHEEATSEFEEALRLSPDSSRLLALLAGEQALAGNAAAAQNTLQKLLALPANKVRLSHDLSIVYTAFGDKDKALDWLEKAYQERSEVMVFIRVDPYFDSLRAEPRFIKLVELMSLN